MKARLEKLAEMSERNAYAELVKDITPRKDINEPFSSYKDQLGFGEIKQFMHIFLSCLFLNAFTVGQCGNALMLEFFNSKMKGKVF